MEKPLASSAGTHPAQHQETPGKYPLRKATTGASPVPKVTRLLHGTEGSPPPTALPRQPTAEECHGRGPAVSRGAGSSWQPLRGLQPGALQAGSTDSLLWSPREQEKGETSRPTLQHALCLKSPDTMWVHVCVCPSLRSKEDISARPGRIRERPCRDRWPWEDPGHWHWGEIARDEVFPQALARLLWAWEHVGQGRLKGALSGWLARERAHRAVPLRQAPGRVRLGPGTGSGAQMPRGLGSKHRAAHRDGHHLLGASSSSSHSCCGAASLAVGSELRKQPPGHAGLCHAGIVAETGNGACSGTTGPNPETPTRVKIRCVEMSANAVTASLRGCCLPSAG